MNRFRESIPVLVPTYSGGILTKYEDALVLVIAVAKGSLPRATRCPLQLEVKNLVVSGNIFVIQYNRDGIERWRDTIAWSRSRTAGKFLLYCDKSHTERPSTRVKRAGPALSLERTFGETRPAANGFYKKTITLKWEGRAYRVVSYFCASDVERGWLLPPSRDLELQRHIAYVSDWDTE